MPSLSISPGPPQPPQVQSPAGWKYPSAAGEKPGGEAGKYWALLQSDAPDAPFLAQQKRLECAFALLDRNPKPSAQVQLDADVARKALCGDWTREQLRASNSVTDAQLLIEGAKRGDLAARLALTQLDKKIDPQIIVDLSAEGVRTQQAGFFFALKQALSNPQARQRLKVVGYPVATHYGHIAYAAEMLACEFGTDCGSGSAFRLRYCSAGGSLCGNEDIVTELTKNETPQDRTVLLDILARLRLALQTGTNPVTF